VKRPIDTGKAFGYFGLIIGSLPVLAVIARAFPYALTGEETGIAILYISAALGTGLVGFCIGWRLVPGAVSEMSEIPLPIRLPLWSLLGLIWGAVSGAVGGVVIMIVGSFLGMIVGGIVGAVTVPIMLTLHSTVRVGEFVETKHFLPIAFGIALTVCALILGL
jgi:hypothetical protein